MYLPLNKNVHTSSPFSLSGALGFYGRRYTPMRPCGLRACETPHMD